MIVDPAVPAQGHRRTNSDWDVQLALQPRLCWYRAVRVGPERRPEPRAHVTPLLLLAEEPTRQLVFQRSSRRSGRPANGARVGPERPGAAARRVWHLCCRAVVQCAVAAAVTACGGDGGTGPAVQTSVVETGALQTAPGRYTWFSTRAAPAWFAASRTVDVTLTWSVTSGDTAGVVVSLTDEGGFIDLRRQRPYAVFYESARTTGDRFEGTLPRPGLYFLIVDNRTGERVQEVRATLEFAWEGEAGP